MPWLGIGLSTVLCSWLLEGWKGGRVPPELMVICKGNESQVFVVVLQGRMRKRFAFLLIGFWFVDDQLLQGEPMYAARV